MLENYPMDLARRQAEDRLEWERLAFPADDGKPMEDGKHGRNSVILRQSLEWYAREVGLAVYATGNIFVYYDSSNPKKNVGPDFLVVLDPKEDPDRDCWRVWNEQHKTPAVVVEFLSKSTEKKDREKNFIIYRDDLRVANYFLCDNRRKMTLEGFQLNGRSYLAIKPDARERLYCDQLDLYLGFHEGLLRWFRPDGHLVPTAQELCEQEAQRAEQAERRAEQAERRAEHEALRAVALQQELESLRRRLEELG